MNILMINTLYYPFKVGGAEVSVRLLAESLVRKGHRVRVLSTTNENSRRLDIVNGVEVVYLPNTNVYWPFENKKRSKIEKLKFHLIDTFNFKMQGKINQELDEFMPDIAHTNNLFGFSCLTWLTLAKRKIKIVHTTRDFYLLHINAALYRNNRNIEADSLEVRLMSFIKVFLSRKVDCICGISKYMSDVHKKLGFSPTGLHTYIYNTVQKPEYLSIPHQDIVIGFLGRLTVEKGFDVFCDIAKKFRKENTERKIKFIASGPIESLTDELKNKAEKANVDLTGFIPLEEFLAKTDAVLLPTKWNEPFGRVIAELGLADKIIFTNLTGGTKEIAEYFNNIHPVELFSIEKIVNTTGGTLDNDVYNRFSCEKIRDDYEELYVKVINYEKK